MTVSRGETVLNLHLLAQIQLTPQYSANFPEWRYLRCRELKIYTLLGTSCAKKISQGTRMVVRSVLIVLLLAFGSASATEGYYQSPSIRGDTVVFTAEGDLWLYRLGDEQAERLTTHPSLETNASISPDGHQIAFVSDYEGVSEVYLIPILGGVPRRLTYENAAVIIHGWAADNQVLYSTYSRSGAPSGMTLKTVSIADLNTVPIPLADAYDGIIDSQGEYIYFTQFGLQWSGDNANIYRGGMRGKLWRFRLGGSDEATKVIPDHSGNVRRPMSGDKRVYFVSDASGRDNIWSVNPDGTDARQLTHHDDFSIRGVSLDGGRIVYQLGADLRMLDLSSLESQKLSIQLASDHPSMRETWVTEPLQFITDARLAGDGEKVTITARGKIAVAGVDEVRLVTVGTPHRSRMRNAVTSRDGTWVYTMSDASGELELWRYDASGAPTAEQMTKGSDTMRGSFVESPDGQWIAHDDGDGGLWLLNTETKADKKIVGNSDTGHAFGDVEWAPDSSRLAVSHRSKEDARPRILLHDILGGKQAYLTSDKYESAEPTFSHDGKWLYYLSNRNFASTSNSVWQDRDFGPSFAKRTQVFAQALSSDAAFPFRIPTELSTEPSTDKKDAVDEADDPEDVPVEIEWDGLEARVWQVPVASGDYSDIKVNEGFMYLLAAVDEESELKVLKLEPHAELATFSDSTVAFELSDDGTKVLVVKQADDEFSLFIVPAEGEFPEDVSKNTVQIDGWQFSVDPQAEWVQFFNDAWFMHREQFFDADMRGLDWVAIRDKYAPLVERVTERRELNDVLGQMMGELNTLHSAVRGGDFPSDPNAPSPAVLGAELKQTKRGVEITHIYRHEIEVPAEASPLARNGVDAADGDVIVAINGIKTPNLELVHRTLRNQAGKQVLLELKRGREAIKTVVVPDGLFEDFNLAYRDWIQTNRSKVESAGSELGYVHIRAMGAGDVAAFAREFYASDSKKGMVIDVRRNDGGNVDSWIIDRLMRKAWMFWSYRSEVSGFNLQNVFRGHLVVIADEGTYSDGETFTAAIKKLGIAPVIGKRTAGAGVWLSGRNRLSDAGIARVAEFPAFDMEGHWIVEGYGVSPTIEVDNLPHATYEGSDAQLDAGIAYLKQKLEEEPVRDVEARPFPPNGVPAKDATP